MWAQHSLRLGVEMKGDGMRHLGDTINVKHKFSSTEEPSPWPEERDMGWGGRRENLSKFSELTLFGGLRNTK